MIKMRRPYSLESKKKMSDSRKRFFANGGVSPRKGVTLTEETKVKIRIARAKQVMEKGGKRPSITGENNYAWKGEDAGYLAKHAWIYRKKGKAFKCENIECVYPRVGNAGRDILYAPKRFHWANVSKEYKRDVDDYIMLCASCHKKWDLGINSINVLALNI